MSPSVSHKDITPTDADSATSIGGVLSEAVALIEKALIKYRDLGEDRWAVDLSDREELAAVTIKKLIAEARQELKCVSSPESMLAGPLRGAIDSLRAPSVRVAKVQILFHVRDTDAYQRLRTLVSSADVHDVRFTDSPLQEMLLVDRQIAMVVSQFSPSVRQTLFVRSPTILKTLQGLFTNSWTSASPIMPSDRLEDLRRCETTRQILTLLRAGYKDDVAARELGMSVRTYRRRVADMMRDVDATSRFQAGTRVAELKLLPGLPDQPGLTSPDQTHQAERARDGRGVRDVAGR